MNRGFTVVELLITLVIMAILLTLSVVSMRGLQASARDEERKIDVDTIARGLEEYYKKGNPYYTNGSSKGSYPGANMMVSINGSGWCPGTFWVNPAHAAYFSICRNYMTEVLPGVSDAALTPPGKTSPTLSFSFLGAEASPVAIINPSITTYLNNGDYVYKPLNDSDEGLCYSFDSCRRYVLLYKKETTGEVVIVKSKHR